MMTAHQVIESYVRDVAHYLPRKKRDDVAFELRALLEDELSAQASAAGRAADRGMAMEILSRFGRPSEAAARYQPRPALIDPSDNHDFLIWAVAGALVFSALNPGNRLAWAEWVGGAFVYFAVEAWLRRHSATWGFRWRPSREKYPETGSRLFPLVAGLATLVFPFAMYLAPRTWWTIVSMGAGHAEGLALTEAFLHSWQRAATLIVLAAVVGIYALVALRGGWSRASRRALIAAYLLLGSMLVAHALPMMTLIGRQPFAIFESPIANAVALPFFGLAGGITVVGALYDAYREWARVTPAPALPHPASA